MSPAERIQLINQLQALTEIDLTDFIQRCYGRRHVPAMNHGHKQKVTSLVDWAESIRGVGLEQLAIDLRVFLTEQTSGYSPPKSASPHPVPAEPAPVDWTDDDWQKLLVVQNRIPGFDHDETRKSHLLAIDSVQMRNGGFDNLITIRSGRLFNASIIEHLKKVDEKLLLKRHLKELREISGNSADKNWLDQKIGAM